MCIRVRPEGSGTSYGIDDNSGATGNRSYAKSPDQTAPPTNLQEKITVQA